MKKRKLGRKLLGFLLALVLVVGLMPGMALTANAQCFKTGESTYTVTFSSDGTSVEKIVLNFAYGDDEHKAGKSGDYIGKTYDATYNFVFTKDKSKCQQHTRIDGHYSGWGSFADDGIPATAQTVTATLTSQNATYGVMEGTFTLDSFNTLEPDTQYYALLCGNYGNMYWYTAEYIPIKLEPRRVTFDTDGGSPVPEVQCVNKGNTITKPTDPTKDNKRFLGWYLNDEEFDFNTGITENITLCAKWENLPATVTYQVVGGTWSDGTTAEKTETVQSGSKPASVPTGMKASSGYTGGSWDTNPAETTITEAKTFTYTFTTKQAATVTKAPTAKNPTYNGQAQALVEAGTAEGGTMVYALGENATTAPADNLYTTSIPAKTDAGTYYVWYKAVGDENHIDSDAAYVAVVIKRLVQCTVTFKVVNGDWNDGTNTDKTVTLSGGEGEALKLTADQIPAVGNKPGSAYKTGSWDTTPNTETAITSNTTYTYTYGDKAENPATVRDTASVMRGGKTIDLAENVTLNGATGAVSYSLSGDAGGCSLNGSILTSGADVHTVYVNVTVAEDDNYKTLDAKRITVSVTDKSQQVIEAEDVSVTYGETDKKVAASVTTPATGGGAITYSVKDGSGDYIDVDASTGLLTVKAVPADGKAYVTAKAAETDTYAEATKDVTITIAQAPVTPKVELNNTALALTVNEESTFTATTVPEGQQVTWTSSDAAIAAVDTTGKVTAKAAGTAKVTATITVEGQEYKAECDVTVTAPAPTPVPSETIVVPEALSDDSLSPEIIERYGSVEQVTVRLEEYMGVTPESRGNSSVFDAQVAVIVDGQARPATPADITPEGLEAVIPYPDGTNKDNFIFSGAQMIGETAGGYQAGDIEGLSFTNADDGLHTRIHGLSPVIITWTAAAPGEVVEADRHVHVYEWDTINATADQDGEMRYQCRICGDIQTRVPITAYYIFNKETTEKIRRAKQGETVKIETARWISFHKMVMEALADRPDVTLEVSFLDEGHKGTRKIFTIPAGTADLTSLVDDKGFCGFIYLSGKFGN
jgi:hypothetical protein